MKWVTKTINIVSILLCAGGLVWTVWLGSEAWITRDQLGARQMNRGDFQDAAGTFRNPFLRGTAEFRSGDFKSAAQTFAGLPGNDALFNQANARIMLGEYEQATKLYERILQNEPNRQDAATNLKIARGRWERVKDEGGQGTDGMLGADEIVFDSGTSNASNTGTEDTVETSQLSDSEMRGLWLREVQTTPGDFLRAKFSFQLAREQNQKTSDLSAEETP